VASAEYIRGSDWGGGVGGLLYSVRSGVPSFKHYNSRGDVISETNDAGARTWEGTYEAYGTRTQEVGSTQDRQKANTKEEDPTGLLNEGFRYRDLETGVFITRDPLGFVDGPNMYAYVVQNPWSKFDPNGLAATDDEMPKFDSHIEDQSPSLKALPEQPKAEEVKPTETAQETNNITLASTSLFMGQQLGDAGAVRDAYNNTVSLLAPGDRAARTAAKTAAREATPTVVKKVIEQMRPDTGPKTGSTGSANKTNATANSLGSTMKVGGRVLVAGALISDGIDIATSDNPARTTVKSVFGWGGATLGGVGGAALGSTAGPVGTVGGAIAGGAGGGAAGRDFGGAVYDSFDQPQFIGDTYLSEGMGFGL
jgi:RHS repeat-associated protein